MGSSTNAFNYLFLKRFCRLLHIFIPFSRVSLGVHSPKEHVYQHPLVLILLTLINECALQYIIYLVGFLPSQFLVQLSAIPEKRDIPRFQWLLAASFVYVAINAFLKSLSQFFASLLYVKWRTRLVTYLHSIYFTRQRYYHLLNTTQQHQNTDVDHSTVIRNYAIQTTDLDEQDVSALDHMSTDRSTSPTQSIDNPDQRITQDADSLCKTLSSIIPLLLISPFTIGYYVYRTWQITGYWGPLAIVIYFVLWTGLNKLFISAVSRTIYVQNLCEGNFRFLHTQIRTHNESIAFYDGGSFEHLRFDRYFTRTLTRLLYRRAILEFFLSLSTNLFDYIGSILSYLLLAVAIFVFHLYENLSPADLVKTTSQTSFITMYLIYRFSQLNDLTDQLTLIAANTHRVQNFIDWMIDMDTTWTQKENNREMPRNEILLIKNLSYSSPINRTHVLMRNLNLTLNDGQRIIITGDSGVGKTSLFRVLHSIWPVTMQGSFSFNSACAYLLPQRPYFTNQSLHDELAYPDVGYTPTVTRQIDIERLLAEWDLGHALESVESSVYTCPKYAWQDLLSPGELQRLSFLRLVLRLSSYENTNRPPVCLIFLDEITSNLDIKMEMKMYNYLIEQNLTMMSIGHRQTLKQYHKFELKLYKNGLHTIEDIQNVN